MSRLLCRGALDRGHPGTARWFADRVDAPQRRQLLSDLEQAQAEPLSDDGATVRFHLEGYSPPLNSYEHPLPVDAMVTDSDGATLLVVLAQDDNGRLYELQLVRYEHGEVINPDWTTLRLLKPAEIAYPGKRP